MYAIEFILARRKRVLFRCVRCLHSRHIPVIDDFVQFMAIRAVYDQRTSGRLTLATRFQLIFYPPQIRVI